MRLGFDAPQSPRSLSRYLIDENWAGISDINNIFRANFMEEMLPKDPFSQLLEPVESYLPEIPGGDLVDLNPFQWNDSLPFSSFDEVPQAQDD